MGGSGSMSAASISLKNNRALLNRKTFRDLKSLYKTSYSKEKPKFKEVSKEELLVIKKQIQEKALAHRKQSHLITAFAFVVVIVTIVSFAILLVR
jgi:hypothetical protein